MTTTAQPYGLADRGVRRAAVDTCIARATDPSGHGARTYLKLWTREARVVANSLDAMADVGYVTALDGMPVSVKDLLDVAGEVTRAGAAALDDAPPATADARVVMQLKHAGAVLVGRTTMTPFAYSVVGLNDRFGTPGNPADTDRTPGGSSSGAAVSVAAGMAVAAIGSDTGGSIRVPAALCGVVGFRPSRHRVSTAGVILLSPTLDSIGPIATTVGDCARLFAVIAGTAGDLDRRRRGESLRLAMPDRCYLDELDPNVSAAFDRGCRRLRAAGTMIVDQLFDALSTAAAGALVQTIQSAEAFTWHEELLARRGDAYDPRILARILRGRDVSAADYVRALARRDRLMTTFDRAMADIDAVILPTVPVVAPTFAECLADEDGVRTTLMRNTAPFNLLDACAITLPIHAAGELPVGLMLAAPSGRDERLLDVARAVEAALQIEGA